MTDELLSATTTGTLLREKVGAVHQKLVSAWADATPRRRVTLQLAVVIGSVVIAYNYTLVTLLQNVGLETPLAYVSLVPIISLFLALVRKNPPKDEPPIHDRQLDYIIGLPLIATAIIINLVLPKQLSVVYWTNRYDLLSLPLFVAGIVAIVFGTRIMWRQKLAIGFLFLAWPMPYQSYLLGVLSWFTNVTIDTLDVLVRHVHVAAAIPGSGGLFNVVHKGVSFPLSVVSACSGVNSVVGFLLIGASFGAVVKGPKVRKLLWLVGGMLVIWMMNILRLMFIFWAGRQWGEHVAISILHPFVGLVTFSIGVVFMIVLIRPLGMSLGGSLDDRGSITARSQVGARLAVPKINAAIVVAVVVALVLGGLDSNLKIYNLVANSAGEPTLTSFDVVGGGYPAGFIRSYDASYTWATPYFGDASTWNRYEFIDAATSAATRTLLRSPRVRGQSAVAITNEALASAKGDLGTNLPVYEDVIDTTDLNSFSAYGIEACYQFHGYTLRDVSDVSLGGGITGQTLAYQTPTDGAWSIVYWIVPVTEKGSTHYERIVLYLENSPISEVRAPSKVAGVRNLSGSLTALGQSGQVLIRNRNFLVTFARTLIADQAKAGSVLKAA